MAIDPNLVTTVRVGELPPVPPTLLSKVPHELGDVLNYYTIEQLVTFLQPYIGTFQYEVKRLNVTQQYIDDNFDETGLGINLCVGWAIMNGANGTDNIDGRVGIPYGTVNGVMKQLVGNSTASISSQIEGYGVGADTDNPPAGRLIISSGLDESGEFLESVKKVSTAPTPQNISIEQKGIVQLYMMKL